MGAEVEVGLRRVVDVEVTAAGFAAGFAASFAAGFAAGFAVGFAAVGLVTTPVGLARAPVGFATTPLDLAAMVEGFVRMVGLVARVDFSGAAGFMVEGVAFVIGIALVVDADFVVADVPVMDLVAVGVKGLAVVSFVEVGGPLIGF